MAVRQRGAGWQADLTHKGKRHRADFTTKEEAELWEAQAKAALLAGKPLPNPRITPSEEDTGSGWTLADAVDRTNKRVWNGTPGGDTAMHNANAALVYFGQRRKLDTITEGDLDEYIAHLEDLGNSNGTINRKLAALSKVMSFAVDRGGMKRKPKIERKKETQGRIRYLTAEEEVLALTTLALWSKDDHHDAFVVLVDTGIRMGELFRIEARDIDFRHNMLSVWQTKADLPRSVPMTKRVRAVLERRAKAGGKLFDYDHPWFRHTWDRLRSHMGMTNDPQFVPHALRHTTASRLIQRGIGIAVVKQWLGHKTISVTMRYAHLAPANLMAAVGVLEGDAA